MNNLIQNNTIIYTENIDRLGYLNIHNNYQLINLNNVTCLTYRYDYDTSQLHNFFTNITANSNVNCFIKSTNIPANTETIISTLNQSICATNLTVCFNLSFSSSDYNNFTSNDNIVLYMKIKLTFNEEDLIIPLINQQLSNHYVNVCSCVYKCNLNYYVDKIDIICKCTQDITLMSPMKLTSFMSSKNVYINYITV